MTVTDNQTQECNPLGVYAPGEPRASPALLWVGLVHCYCVIVIGSLGNAVALWCVMTCRHTRRPVKVLLISVFLPALLVCLVTRPLIAEVRVALLICDLNRVSKTALKINSLVYNILAQIEVTSIAVVAVTRAANVWAPHRPGLGMRGTVVLMMAVCVYAVVTGMIVMRLALTGALDKVWIGSLITCLYFLDAALPALVTAAAYILIVFVIQRNKRRLAASQRHGRDGTVMDHATRALLAVFISNLIFGIPHSIHHLMGKQPHHMKIIFHVLFSTHFVVDPLAFVWFNSGYRRRVVAKVRTVAKVISSPPSSLLQAVSATNNDHQQHSSKQSNEDMKI